MPRHIIVFAFETWMPNLIRQRQDYLSFQPSLTAPAEDEPG